MSGGYQTKKRISKKKSRVKHYRTDPKMFPRCLQEKNKKSAIDFYETAINQRDFIAASKYLGPKYSVPFRASSGKS